MCIYIGAVHSLAIYAIILLRHNLRKMTGHIRHLCDQRGYTFRESNIIACQAVHCIRPLAENVERNFERLEMEGAQKRNGMNGMSNGMMGTGMPMAPSRRGSVDSMTTVDAVAAEIDRFEQVKNQVITCYDEAVRKATDTSMLGSIRMLLKAAMLLFLGYLCISCCCFPSYMVPLGVFLTRYLGGGVVFWGFDSRFQFPV